MKKLKDICDFYPKSKIRAGEGMKEGKYPFYTSSSVLNKYLDFYENENDGIILGTGGSASIHYCEEKFSVSTDCLVISSKNNEIMNEYLYYYLLNNIYILENGFRGAGLKHISKKYIEDIEIKYIPSILTQKKIIESIKLSEHLIHKRKEQIEQLDELVKSKFIEMFGDPTINPKGFPISSLINCYDKNDAIKCGPFGSALKKHEYTEKGIPVWNMDNISKTGEFFDKPNLWITNEKYESLKNYETKNGDIIISRAGTVGKMSVVDSAYKNSIISTNLIRLRLNEKLLPIYFVILINIFGNKVCRLQTGSDGAFTHMNTGVLNSIEIPLPPIELQNKFVYFLKKVKKFKIEMENSLKELEDNFNSLMQKSFKGELF